MRHSSVGITLGVYRTVTQGEIKAQHARRSPVADTFKANKATPDKRTSSNPHLSFAPNLFLVLLFLFLGLLGFFHIFSSLSSHLFPLSFLILSFIIIYLLIFAICILQRADDMLWTMVLYERFLNAILTRDT